MNSMDFIALACKAGISFFTGVPDSLLQPFCNDLYRKWGSNAAHHVVAHNEGGSVGLAAGHYLATGKPACVYMQNSGIGNIVNPVASLMDAQVYGIPALYVIGWRGQPGVKDEPQHIFQGAISEKMLENIGLSVSIITPETTDEAVEKRLNLFFEGAKAGKSAAFLVEKGAFAGSTPAAYQNIYTFSRESAVGLVAASAAEDIIVSSTGQISRELFEIREKAAQGHEKDFLTVGSMGHDSMIALGIALKQPQRHVWCLEGDGSFLMHLGAAGLIGSLQPANLIHVVLNNSAHDTVGGMPTYAGKVDLLKIAAGMGYRHTARAADEQQLLSALGQAKTAEGPAFIEVCVALGARGDLGRPTTTPQENKAALMAFLQKNK